MNPIPFTTATDIAVSEIMSSPVVALDPNMNLLQVQQLFNNRDISHATVIDRNALPIGILSTTDLLRVTDWRACFQPASQHKTLNSVRASLRVEEVMTRHPVCISEDGSLAEAAEFFHSRKFHALPVVDADGKLTGMITAHDLLRAAYPPTVSVEEGGFAFAKTEGA